VRGQRHPKLHKEGGARGNDNTEVKTTHKCETIITEDVRGLTHPELTLHHRSVMAYYDITIEGKEPAFKEGI